MKISLYLFVIALGAVLSPGCTSRPKQIEPGKIPSLVSQPGYGLLFGSYSRPDPKSRFTQETVRFRNLDTNKKYKIGIHRMPFIPLEFDYVEESEAGNLFTFSLPAGEYEIFDFQAVQDTIAGPVSHHPMRKFSIRFTVEAGNACYLGSIQILRRSGTFKFAMTDGVQFVMRSNLERDEGLLHSKYPELEWSIADVYPQDPPDLEMFRVIKPNAKTSGS